MVLRVDGLLDLSPPCFKGNTIVGLVPLFVFCGACCVALQSFCVPATCHHRSSTYTLGSLSHDYDPDDQSVITACRF